MTTKIIISLPAELLSDLDIYCKKYKYNRSECIRHAIRGLWSTENEKLGEKNV